MKIHIKHVAKLANLLLSNEEEKKFEKQLSNIITYVEKLNSVNVTNIKITSQITGLENVTREDRIEPSIPQKKALSNAKSKYKGFFKVKRIL